MQVANERLTALQGKQTLDEVAAADAALLERNLLAARADADSLRTQLAAAQQHATRFKVGQHCSSPLTTGTSSI